MFVTTYHDIHTIKYLLVIILADQIISNIFSSIKYMIAIKPVIVKLDDYVVSSQIFGQ